MFIRRFRCLIADANPEGEVHHNLTGEDEHDAGQSGADAHHDGGAKEAGLTADALIRESEEFRYPAQGVFCDGCLHVVFCHV